MKRGGATRELDALLDLPRLLSDDGDNFEDTAPPLRRESWCIAFRHPAKLNADGKPGLRVRKGLPTSDPVEGQHLVDQMNQILARQELWNPVAREEAARAFDPHVVAAFYHNLDPAEYNPWALRDGLIPLPGQEIGYVGVMFAGTTGGENHGNPSTHWY